MLIEAAYLHDTIEDTNATYYDIVHEFGPGVASIVLELTTDEDMKNLRFFMESGTYGTIEHKVEQQENKWSYLWKRIVPDDVWLQSYVPMVYKHKVLLPFFVIGRLWKNRTRAWKELKLIVKK